jgi:hypothetical protein
MRSVSPGALPGFLRQHYTTGNDMAGSMAAYVLGSGGTQQVAEPPTKREPKQEPRPRAKADGTDVAARTPDAKEQSKSARQKAAKRGQPEPSAKDAPPVHESEKADAAKHEAPAAEPEPPATEPARTEAAAAADCKVEQPTKQVDESKPGLVMAQPSEPRQPVVPLTLPGFPAPEPEPEPAAKHEGCEPAANGASTPARADASPAEQPKEQVNEQVKEQAKEQAKDEPREAAPAAPPATLAEAPKSEPLRAMVSEPAALDIMREEVHGPLRPARASQQKKRAQ